MVDQNTQQIELDDPLFDNQWHLFKSGSARVDINLSDVWSDYTGDGVVVGVIEGAVQWTHPDLIGNYDAGLDFSGTDNSADVSASGASSHATAVAGLIAAEANGEGVVGVAYDSTLVSYHIDFSGSFYTAFERVMDVAVDGNSAYGIDRGADIINNSWAFTSPFAGNFNSGFSQLQTMGSALEEAAGFGREGLGTVMLWAAGNDSLDGGDVLLGGTGNDRLIGGLGADVFVFTLGDGRDRIDDFDPVNDLLDLTSWGLSSFSELDVTDGDNGAEISFNGSDQLILDGVETLSIEDAWAIWA